ncbi:Deoxyuridine 5'-triphosphate nucleotidohydrolase [Rhodovastum atsumiense]|uniref:Deoxyuridine 5'-triphosphate nucleotidohydrolase n=1 Tax=Rhodovastum atsumiense TaxID=504468 RepID=A0A5M6IT01_9PROT|nr:dUTP diphosphatase [Rhodovastum atsumiense]KAA5611029.1 dUTP diphosphatase [Rhodovastum atsumiense]CAH2600186.1 Deoxyuridine 5'-triphosphate nucleotidohydrolase [Rhodovastum atsumiense]
MTQPPSPAIRFLRLDGNTDLPIPTYATAGAAGFDLRAAVPAGEPTVLLPGQRLLVPVGFAVALPPGLEMQVRPRSGLAVNHGVTVLNSPGTVDCDYRGPLAVCLINLGSEPFPIRRGDRIAQAIIAPAPQYPLVEAESLDATERGEGGFGSTGLS